MNCTEISPWIHPYADGELDFAKAVEVEQHLASCERCAAMHRQILSLRAALRQPGVADHAPASLKKKVRAGIRREAGSKKVAPPFWVTFGAAFACLAVWMGSLVLEGSSSSTNRLADEVASSHVRSLLATHLMDVASTDQHTVKPWFDGKIDFAPEVIDLASEGFPLAGGRLDYLDGRAAVALVYKRQKHWINLFIWPATGAKNTAPSEISRRGYHLIHWTRGEMNYWAVSDLNFPELREFTSQLGL